MIAGILACLLCATSAMYHTDNGHGATSAAGADPVAAMIDCRLWLSGVEGCPRLPVSRSVNTLATTSTSGQAVGPDVDGIKRDTYYFLGLQLSIIGALYFMPESVSGWSDQQKEQHHAKKWWNNVSGPTWDDDDDYINYVLHPYWGAAYYVRARERGYGSRQAFWYSFLLSTLYETGVEALFEPVSIQDFFVTPIVGAWLGGHFMDWRRAVEARVERTGTRRFRDSALLVATDPLGHAAGFVDRRLGRKAELTATPFILPGSAYSTDPFVPQSRLALEETYGLKLTLRW